VRAASEDFLFSKILQDAFKLNGLCALSFSLVTEFISSGIDLILNTVVSGDAAVLKRKLVLWDEKDSKSSLLGFMLTRLLPLGESRIEGLLCP